MKSLISINRQQLKGKHYIRLATSFCYWFDFTSGRMQSYVRRHGDNFCIVINGSEDNDDTFIIPYKDARKVFTSDALDGRKRWTGYIRHNTLRIPTGDKSLLVERFHNAFHLLESS